MPARLTVEAGTASPTSCDLAPNIPFFLGRKRNSHVILRDEHASRQHAEIFFRENCWYLRDCGSINGTRVNGRRIRDTVVLEHGAQIGIGAVSLRFTADSLEATPPAGYKFSPDN